MRKNNFNLSFLNRFITCRLQIRGLNLDRLIEKLKKNKIKLYNIKKHSVKELSVDVEKKDLKKIFAITDELCYNVNIIKTKGKLYPLYFIYKNLGLLLGCIFFIALVVFFNGIIFSFEFTGSGNIYYKEVTDYLYSINVKPYTRFNKIDYKALSNGILINVNNLTFAQVQKDGNRLKIELVKGNEQSDRLLGTEKSLISNVNGVIENVKVYRGTAVKKVGDTVNNGEVIVDGYALIKENRIDINVIAFASIICCDIQKIQLEVNEPNLALIFATEKLNGEEIISSTVEKKELSNKYEFTVKTEYRRWLNVG